MKKTLQKKTHFEKIVDEVTGGCGCGCHTGIGYKTACKHCHLSQKEPEEWYGKWKTMAFQGATLKEQADFIRQLLSSQRTQTIEEIKKWHEEIGWDCVAAGEGQECCIDKYLDSLK